MRGLVRRAGQREPRPPEAIAGSGPGGQATIPSPDLALLVRQSQMSPYSDDRKSIRLASKAPLGNQLPEAALVGCPAPGPSVTEMMSGMAVGILAFGSITGEPGTELAAAATRRIEVVTPFAVEFARSSRTRDGAPTLVPVSEGGAHVPATVLVLDDSVTVADARAMLYRRETGRLYDTGAGSRAVWIAELASFAGTSTCLYTALQANIRPLTAEKLAELAVRSAAAPAGAERRDGISYLQQQKRRGLVTPLMPAYEEGVLTRTGADDLAGAWERARLGAVRA